GSRPFAAPETGPIVSKEGCKLLLFNNKRLEKLRLDTPQFNYYLHKLRMLEPDQRIDWALGMVDIHN
ncbi:MAG TPA: hypothetical protein DCM64_08200, partial [Gammaproteobacteria bacterium]|nr:hypothetical protein [Gammaproteobacteria bacterium]